MSIDVGLFRSGIKTYTRQSFMVKFWQKLGCHLVNEIPGILAMQP